uniref:Uncharacterized protein n=1 Tax=Marinobacter nauticus TaxID=2743 RepID=A0A455W9K4_MARNT|nr:hypothetical protein YBY_11930 [Marinobacter nauticus]
MTNHPDNFVCPQDPQMSLYLIPLKHQYAVVVFDWDTLSIKYMLTANAPEFRIYDSQHLNVVR